MVPFVELFDVQKVMIPNKRRGKNVLVFYFLRESYFDFAHFVLILFHLFVQTFSALV